MDSNRPALIAYNQQRIFTDTFGGINKRLRIGDGEFSDETNMSGDDYPVLSTRKARGIVRTMTSPQGIAAKDKLVHVDANAVYYDGAVVAGLTLSAGEKSFVSMGAYLLIFPDKKYLNTASLTDFGSIDNSVTVSGASYSMTRPDGTDISSVTVAATPPESPTGGDYWIDTSEDPNMLMVYSAIMGTWAQVATVLIKISATGIGVGFRAGDGVTVSGAAYTGANIVLKGQIEGLNADHVLYAADDDYIVVTGQINAVYTQSTALTVSRNVPDMDFVVESENRLWGCKYGLVGGVNVNEIYASKLGDFRNWRAYSGISTDSYAAGVGTDGPFTGAAKHMGTPLFFKENCIHEVQGYKPANFEIGTLTCRGVQKGSHKSLVSINETLYYKGINGIYAYSGGYPVCISDNLPGLYTSAAAGAFGDKYYISMYDSAWHLFSYDVRTRIWHREDAVQVMMFAANNSDLFFINAADKKLYAVNGSAGSAEAAFTWMATTGTFGYDISDQKYVSRFNLRLKMAQSATITVSIQYDSNGEWIGQGSYTAPSALTDTVMIPVIPRRCDHFQVKLAGTGQVKLLSFDRKLEGGADGKWHNS